MPEAKSLLADAAVIGKVFWAGAVAAMGDRDPQAVTTTLRELSRKELVRPSRQSSMEGEAEYAFWHVLARDVAYHQLPRASRATRHVAAASWIESKAPERIEDLADVLAYHYATALELAQAAGQTDQAAELEAPALRFLGLAGERALGLDTAAAVASFERALALTPEGHPGPGRGAGPLRRGRPRTRGASTTRETRWSRRSMRSKRAVIAAPRPRRSAPSAWCSPGSEIRGRGICPPRRWRCWSHCHPAPTTSPRSPHSPRRGTAG